MKKKGIGYASTFYGTGYGNGFPDESRATAKIESNGTINIYVEVSDVGSGGKSVMWQIATKTLNIDEKLVNIINTNTSTMKDSGTAAASRQTYNTGNAVLNACNKLRDNINNVVNKTEKITSSDQSKNILQDMSKNNISTFEEDIIYVLENIRQKYLETKDNRYWKELVRWLPESWLQKRTITMNYENVRNMYFQRRNHKLTEWSDSFIKWVESLPYAEELIMYDEKSENP